MGQWESISNIYITKIVVLVSEPVRGRSRATELPCYTWFYLHLHTVCSLYGQLSCAFWNFHLVCCIVSDGHIKNIRCISSMTMILTFGGNIII